MGVGETLFLGGAGGSGWMGHYFGWVEVSGDEWGIILGGWGRVGKHFR